VPVKTEARFEVLVKVVQLSPVEGGERLLPNVGNYLSIYTASNSNFNFIRRKLISCGLFILIPPHYEYLFTLLLLHQRT
jgi:hypothetical protein